MDLVALADFNLVARHGGFARAARATGRSKTTMSRHVALLEAELGLRLFERGAREPKLTQEGALLHERASALLGELDEVAVAVASRADRPRGTLRISVPVLFGQAVMGRLAAVFLRGHPEMRIEITAEDRLADPIEDGYDLVVRVNPTPDERLIGRRFYRDKLVVVAPLRFAIPEPGRPVPAVTLGPTIANSWRLEDDNGAREIACRTVLHLSSWLMVRDAVRAGAGAAILPMSLIADDIAQGRVAHWGDVAGGRVDLWLLYPSRRLLNRRVSAFSAFLFRAIAGTRPH